MLHVIHVAGTRMKAWGVDGLSRADLLDGMMAGEDPLSFIPLDKGAGQRSEGRVQEWIRKWWGGGEGAKPALGAALVEVTKEMMFELNTVEGARLWVPPPAAMEVVMEMYNEDRIAHPWNTHIFAVPRLMTHLWRKSLFKDADLNFTVTTGNHFWSFDQHEPLIIAVVLPLAHTQNYRGPWVAKGTPEASTCKGELECGFKLGNPRAAKGCGVMDMNICACCLGGILHRAHHARPSAREGQ